MNAVTTHNKNEGAVSRDRLEAQERYLSPEVDIRETKDEYVLEAEMPGVTKEGLELTLEGHVLTITGHRNHEVPKGNLLYRESHPYDYRRVFELDPAINTEKINARMDHGILVVTLPKAERVKPRKITVGD